MTILFILITILLFGALIAIHEFGHFIAAKTLGVRVEEFAIGMGPKLLSRTRGETTYSLRALPIGGFCSMEGEEEASDDPRPIWTAAPTSSSWRRPTASRGSGPPPSRSSRRPSAGPWPRAGPISSSAPSTRTPWSTPWSPPALRSPILFWIKGGRGYE